MSRVAALSVGLTVTACAQQPNPDTSAVTAAPAPAPTGPLVSQECMNSYKLSKCTLLERMRLHYLFGTSVQGE